MSCEECGAGQFEVYVTTRSSCGVVDPDGGVFHLPANAFESPDFIDVEILCTACGCSTLIPDSQWEYQ